MKISGSLLIGSKDVVTNQPPFFGVNPATNETIDIAFYLAGNEEVEQACQLAELAFDEYRSLPASKRATFLRQITEEIAIFGDVLIDQVILETGLPAARVVGERARTINQLIMFADMLDQKHWRGARRDSALPDRVPPRPDIRYKKIALGPVAVFGASNFPLAFSVAGGDTASALAAGCPVVVKAHSAHPGTSWLVGKAIQQAAKKTGMPEGVFALLYGKGNEIGTLLVSNPAIKAVGFTGSKTGGLALVATASNRAEPIPVYAEMSSINPSFFYDSQLTSKNAAGLVDSLILGAGQFCTNPGLVFVKKSEKADEFINQVSSQAAQTDSQTMLTPGICHAYEEGVIALESKPSLTRIGAGSINGSENQCRTAIFKVPFTDYISDPGLNEEVFGACTLIVECESYDDFELAAKNMQGQLTCSIHCENEDFKLAKSLSGQLEKKAGRVIINGFPTGVEVCHSMVHGGPFPATSDGKTTSVGSTAIDRFLRPVCYQGFDVAMLPDDLVAENEFILVDGKPV